MKNDFDDVSLSDGLAYMVPKKDFEAYLARAESTKPLKLTAREKKQVCYYSGYSSARQF